MRELRRYEYVAQKEHWCDRCCSYISLGDYYEGIVSVDKNHRIVVFKQHKNPCCEFPPDPDESCSSSKSLEKTIRVAA